MEPDAIRLRKWFEVNVCRNSGRSDVLCYAKRGPRSPRFGAQSHQTTHL
jgi:hypothetical protein